MGKRYIVTLSQEEREQLRELVSAGRGAARAMTHARILLKADQSEAGPGWQDRAISEALEVSIPTIERVRRRFVEAGLEAALHRKRPQREYQHKLDGEQEAHLIALACSEPPTGRSHWSLRLLAEKMVALEYVESLAHETVRQVLKKTNSSRG